MTCIGRLGNKTLRSDFLGIGPTKKLKAQKLWTYFRRLRSSMARANISEEEHDINNRETTLETTKAGSPTSSQNFMNFGPLTANNRRTGVFTHPPKILHFSSFPGFAHATNGNIHRIPHVIKTSHIICLAAVAATIT